MKQAAFAVILILNLVRLWPHLILWGVSGNKGVILYEVKRWSRLLKGTELVGPTAVLMGFLHLMVYYDEFRNLFYHRVGWKARPFHLLCPPLSSLHLATRDIQPGLFIQHGFSTIIAADHIGKDCHVNQQVTIGFMGSKRPWLGNGVTVYAGAKVIGGVRVGDGAVIGANAVVIKDVPDNVVAVGVPAKILPQKK